MINCLQTRRGTIHFINWTTFRGIHYTMCGKSYQKSNKINTYVLDDAIPGACPQCYRIYTTHYHKNAKNMRRTRGHMLEAVVSEYEDIQSDITSTESIYTDFPKYREYPKLRRMKSKMRNNEHATRTKRPKYK
jgi:hypothetical protein